MLVAALASFEQAHPQCASAQIATLVPDDPIVGDWVGISSLAMDSVGGRIAFGSADHSHVGWDRGAVWVVSNPGTALAETIELMPAASFDRAWFGASLAMNSVGDRILIGAPTASSSPGLPAAYVFRFDGATWIEEWSTSSSPPNDGLGYAVAMDAGGELIAIGAPYRTIPPSLDSDGAVEIYRRQSNTWVLERTLALTTDAYYGSRVALSGDGIVLAVRSWAHQTNGSVDLYRRDGGVWNYVANLHETVSHSGNGGFANAIDIDAAGRTVVVGSPYDWRMGIQSGAVFVFREGPSGWSLESEIFLPTPGPGSLLGFSVTIDAAGDRVVAGAPGYVSNGHTLGAVYEYERVNGTWQQVGEYVLPNAPNAGKHTSVGTRVAASATGRRWAASDPISDLATTDGGAVHVFESPCTQPTVYCTAQTNSLGCVPQIGFQGWPSASKLGGFKITLSNTRNQRTGVFFYGTSPSALPWNGGTLCVQSPLRRTPIRDSGGSALPTDDCSGTFAFDFNAWYPNDPALFAGAHVFAQYLSRDPSPTSLVNLSDALDFYVEP